MSMDKLYVCGFASNEGIDMDKIDLGFINKPIGKKSVKNNSKKYKAKVVVEPVIPTRIDNIREKIITKRKGNFVVRYDTVLRYKYSFDYETGESVRSNYFTEEFNPTVTDVFAANFPHLIDVGIMGHCTHGKSGLCLKSGVQCYQDGLHINKPNMSIDDFRRIAEECKDLTNQFALGGRGDPNEHECFEEILAICRENHIIPNYTTSGYGLTDEQIRISKIYCGAVAVSWYRNDYTISAINRLIANGVKTNVHFVLNSNTIDEALMLLENNGFPKGINAVVFLTHKPVGLGQKELCLKYDDERVHRLFAIIKAGGLPFKLGIDGCLVVGLINSELEFNMKYLDTCEAARFTCYIDSDMTMHPCSFDVNNNFTVDIKNKTILDGWFSKPFNEVRMRLKTGCPECKNSQICMGGCFLHKDIVLCPTVQKIQ